MQCCTDAEPSALSVQRKTTTHRRVLAAARAGEHLLGAAGRVVWLVYSLATRTLHARASSAADLLAGGQHKTPLQQRRTVRAATRTQQAARLGAVERVAVKGHRGQRKQSWVLLSAAARAISPGCNSEYARLKRRLEDHGAVFRERRDDPRGALCCLADDVRACTPLV